MGSRQNTDIEGRSEIGLTDQEFEAARLASLRDFEILLVSGQVVRVSAHQHDAGSNASGHLGFLTIDPNGRQLVTRMFSVHIWAQVTDVTPEERRMNSLHANRRLENRRRLEDESQRQEAAMQKKPAGKKYGVH